MCLQPTFASMKAKSHEREDDNPVNFNSVTLLKRSENYEVIN